MYDTVTLWLDRQPHSGILAALSKVAERRDYDSGEVTYAGKLKNLDVQLRTKGVYVSGSLPKFHVGNNLQGLDRSQIARAIEDLSDNLGMPMDGAKVNRLDFGCTFEMTSPVGRYLSALGESRHYERVPYRNGLEYRNSSRALSFYDKANDFRRHRETVLEGMGPNLLRYEYRLTRRVAGQLRRPEVTASMLWGEGLYGDIAVRWQEEYFAIGRLHRLKLGDQVRRVKQLERVLAVAGLKAFGEGAVLAMIEVGELGSMQKYRMRSKVRGLAIAEGLTKPEDAISEIDAKVWEAVRCCAA